jgi:hypothetical protein
MSKLLVGSLLLASLTAVGQTRPPAYMEVLRNVSEALANRDTDAFLDQFDRRMPHYDALHGEIENLFAMTQEIGSTIDIITDEGDEQKRTMELDWLLKIDNAEPRRRIVKCRLEKQGKNWRITALEPVELFEK